MKRPLKIILAVCLCLLLAGCMPFAAELQPSSDDYEMVTPESVPIEPAVGDVIGEYSREATLYYPSLTQQALIPVRKTVRVARGQTLEESLVTALLTETPSADAGRAAPEGTSLLSLRRSGGTVVADLSLEARGVEDARQLLLMRMCVAETLCAVEGVESVDVLIAGRSECPSDVPLGALSHEDAALVSRWTQLGADSGAAASRRQAVLYSPSRDGRFLIPHAETLTFEEDDCVAALIRALGQTPEDPLMAPSMPPSDTPLVTETALVVLPDGRRVARLTFDGSLTTLPERHAISAWQMYASLTCTLTGFLPGLDGIQICIGDGQLVRAESPEGEIAFEGGVMTRALFQDMIGQTETVYMTAENGTLRPLTRALRPEDARSPRMLLSELFDEPRSWEKGVFRVVPDGLSIDDLLGLRIEAGEAVLNFSAGFYAGCQRLTAQQERNLIYALVDTLTNRPDVRAVRFQIEGAAIDTLVGSVSLISPLLRNPGLIEEPDAPGMK